METPAPAPAVDDSAKATAAPATAVAVSIPVPVVKEELAVIATGPSNGNGATAASGNGNGAASKGLAGIAASLGSSLGGGPKVAFSAQADAPSCAECGSIMVRNGSCYKCLNCGSTSGCS